MLFASREITSGDKLNVVAAAKSGRKHHSINYDICSLQIPASL